jgi:hypothetical protein
MIIGNTIKIVAVLPPNMMFGNFIGRSRLKNLT